MNHSKRSTPATQEQLKEQWGQKRFEQALGVGSDWRQGKSHPISLADLQELYAESQDAFELFSSLFYWSAQEWLDS